MVTNIKHVCGGSRRANIFGSRGDGGFRGGGPEDGGSFGGNSGYGCVCAASTAVSEHQPMLLLYTSGPKALTLSKARGVSFRIGATTRVQSGGVSRYGGRGPAQAAAPRAMEAALPVALEDLYMGSNKKLKVTRRVADAAKPGHMGSESVGRMASFSHHDLTCSAASVLPDLLSPFSRQLG